MIVVLLNSYIALLVLFVWLGFVRLNLFWKLSPVFVLLVLLVGLFIPMQWGAPSGPAAVVRKLVMTAQAKSLYALGPEAADLSTPNFT